MSYALAIFGVYRYLFFMSVFSLSESFVCVFYRTDQRLKHRTDVF